MSNSARSPSTADLVNNLFDVVKTNAPVPGPAPGPAPFPAPAPNNGDAGAGTVAPSDGWAPTPASSDNSNAPTVDPTPASVVPAPIATKSSLPTPTPSFKSTPTPTQTSVASAADKNGGISQGKGSGQTALGVSLGFGALVCVIACVYMLRQRRKRRGEPDAYAGEFSVRAIDHAHHHRPVDSEISVELPPPPAKERVSIFSENRFQSEDSVFQAKAEVSPKRSMAGGGKHARGSFQYRPSDCIDLQAITAVPKSNVNSTNSSLSDASPDPASVFATTSANAKLLRVMKTQQPPNPLVHLYMDPNAVAQSRDTATSLNSLHDSVHGGDWGALAKGAKNPVPVAHSGQVSVIAEEADALAPPAPEPAHSPGSGALLGSGRRRPPPPPPPGPPAVGDFRPSRDFPAVSRDTMKRISDVSSVSMSSTSSSDSAGPRAGSLIECIEITEKDKSNGGNGGKEIEI